MSFVAVTLPTVATVGGAYVSSRGSKDAANTVAESSDAATAEQRRQFDKAIELAMPGITAGNTARNQLMQLLGLSAPQGNTLANVNLSPVYRSVGERLGERLPVSLPSGIRGDYWFNRDAASLSRDPRGGIWRQGVVGEGTPKVSAPPSSNDPIDIIKNTPGYQFRLEQGARALNAARSAGRMSGGELMKDFARFNQGVASDFYTDYANRLAALAGTAQTASTNLGSLGVQNAGIIGQNMINAGDARASGIAGSSAAWANAINDIGTFAGQGGFSGFGDWLGGIFGKTGSGGGGITGRSDARMKTNIQKIGEYMGFNIYTWDWKDDIDQPPIGVIAQEVMKTHPDAVSEDENGYLMVDYGKLI